MVVRKSSTSENFVAGCLFIPLSGRLLRQVVCNLLFSAEESCVILFCRTKEEVLAALFRPMRLSGHIGHVLFSAKHGARFCDIHISVYRFKFKNHKSKNF
jgi:hypothetical protein